MGSLFFMRQVNQADCEFIKFFLIGCELAFAIGIVVFIDFKLDVLLELYKFSLIFKHLIFNFLFLCHFKYSHNNQ